MLRIVILKQRIISRDMGLQIITAAPG